MKNPIARTRAGLERAATKPIGYHKDRTWKLALAIVLLLAAQVAVDGRLLAAEVDSDVGGPVKVTKIEDPPVQAPSPVITPDAVVCQFDQPQTAKEGEETVRRIARDEHFNVDLAVAISRQESGFRMDSVSSAGAVGLMQLMPATAKRFDVNICDPEDNVRGGVRYLKLLEKKYANPLYILAAYNAGEAAVEQNSGIPLYPETVRYVSAILTDLYGWQPFNESPVAVANNANRKRRNASEKPDKVAPGPWSQGFVLHLE